jgi:hypothetical protein
MEQGRFSLTPRTQRRSQNFHSDGAKIGIYLITSKFSSSECIENYNFCAESRENSTNSQTFSLFFADIQQKRSFLYASTTSRIDMIYIFNLFPFSGIRLPSIQLSSRNSMQNVL